MSKIQTKPNDMFIATFNAPEATPLELLKSNITAENTSLLSEEEYRNTPFVKKRFTDDKGVFQEEEFQKVYQQAKEKYWDLADQMSYEGLVQYIEYDKDNVYKPATAKIRDTTPTFSYIGNKNPLGQQLGVEGIGVISEPVYSEKEINVVSGFKWIDIPFVDMTTYIDGPLAIEVLSGLADEETLIIKNIRTQTI